MALSNNVYTLSLAPSAARTLSHETLSLPMMEEISPRWLLTFLPWVPVTAGIYRVNKRKKEPEGHCNEHGEKLIEVFSCHEGEPNLPETFADYEVTPREYHLTLVQTILKIHSRVFDLHNVPINQLEEQLRLITEAMQERQEWEIINNREFGLLHAAIPEMRISTRQGTPTPDDLDSLLSLVWKKPAFFLAHPKAIAAFGRECTCRGVPPATVNLYGSPFITWRGVPLVPCDKLMVGDRSRAELCDSGKTNILLMRVGETEQGVIGLHQPGIPEEQRRPSLTVKFSGIDNKALLTYLINLYFSTAVLTNDALGVLENVEVGCYHDKL
ncbi:MAG: family 2A encapsulin nanocompartment shell protein [Bacillota bacterium]|jgi:hypothetical protein